MSFRPNMIQQDFNKRLKKSDYDLSKNILALHWLPRSFVWKRSIRLIGNPSNKRIFLCCAAFFSRRSLHQLINSQLLLGLKQQVRSVRLLLTSVNSPDDHKSVMGVL